MKRTPLRKTKKTNRAKIKEKLMDLVKEYVKIRDDHTCQRCGKKVEGSNCQASHVIPVSAGGRIAYDPINLKVLCYHCHLNWWHKNPTESGEWFKATFPDRWEVLEKAKYIPAVPIKEWEFKEMYDNYKVLLAQMKGACV